MGQREDTACNEDGVDISVGVDDDAVLGVSVHGQGVNLGVSLGVGIVVGSPPLASLDSWGARLISGILMTEINIYPLAEVLPLIHTLYYFLLLLLFNDNDYNKCRSQRCHLLWSKGTWRGVTFTNDVSRNQRSVR